MEWSLPSVALALIAVAAVSKRLSGSPITPAILFVSIGILVGPKVLDAVDFSSTGSTVRALAEATLALVLFSDASRIDLGELRREISVPLRLLGIGLPLTIGLGALAAAVIFDALTFWEAVIIGVILAPTDAALGQAVVTDPRVPGRIRQGLNVESGLNDGICVPLLFAAVAAADVESHISGGRTGMTSAARGGRLRHCRRGRRRAPDRSHHRVRRPLGPDRGHLAPGDPGRRRRPRLRHRERARRIGLHRGLRRRHGFPGGDQARPRGPEPTHRRGWSGAQRPHLHSLRGDPARTRAGGAELEARPLRGPQPDGRANGARRNRDARLARAACRRLAFSVGSDPAVWPRSSSR